MPPRTEAALRIAVRRLDPVEAVKLDQEFRDVWQEAVQTDSTVPMRMFLYKWAVWVELHRYPARSAALRELERAFQETETREDMRRVGHEISEMLKTAEAGVAR
jgi:hypothetical protein